MTKKLLIFLVIISIVFIYKNSYTKAIQKISVELYPNTTNEIAEYTIYLMLEKKNQIRDWIHVQFPKEFKLPVLPEDPIERDKRRKEIVENMYVFNGYGNYCTGLPIIDYEQNLFMFHASCSEAEPFINLKSIFKSKVGIRNPETEGYYRIKVKTKSENAYFESTLFSVLDSKVGNGTESPTVTCSRPSIKQKSDYKISFRLGKAGLLKFGDGKIYIKFPEDIKLPEKLPESNYLMISINNNILCRDAGLMDGNTLSVPINKELLPDTDIVIILKKELGIINPEITGEYQIAVYTKPSDPTPVLSEPFTIYDSPSLEVYPQHANRSAEYIVSFVSDKNIHLYTKDIVVIFPDGTNFLKNPSSNEVLINNVPVDTIILDPENRTLILTIFKNIKFRCGETVEIKFLISTGIITPNKDRMKLRFLTPLSTDYIDTIEVDLEVIDY